MLTDELSAGTRKAKNAAIKQNVLQTLEIVARGIDRLESKSAVLNSL
jgi:hypothetical protein